MSRMATLGRRTTDRQECLFHLENAVLSIALATIFVSACHTSWLEKKTEGLRDWNGA